MPERYAIYFTLNENDPLYRRVSAWLGYSIQTHTPVDAHKMLPKALQPLRALSRGAALYGFHATLKPPFRLQADTSVQQLNRALRRFALSCPGLECHPLKLDRLGRFLVLVPEQHCDLLDDLARDCLKNFDCFRAPPSEQEMSRYEPGSLTENQHRMLMQWGYPYVLEEFRFHMTLTDKLSNDQLKACLPELQAYLQPCLGKRLVIDSLSLCHQQAAGAPFEVVQRFPVKSD